jgi:hypothetical protein
VRAFVYLDEHHVCKIFFFVLFLLLSLLEQQTAFFGDHRSQNPKSLTACMLRPPEEEGCITAVIHASAAQLATSRAKRT